MKASHVLRYVSLALAATALLAGCRRENTFPDLAVVGAAARGGAA